MGTAADACGDRRLNNIGAVTEMEFLGVVGRVYNAFSPGEVDIAGFCWRGNPRR